MNIPQVGEPHGTDELLRELRSLHEQSTAFWDAIPAAELYAPIGEAWSPADNIRHLLKTNRPVARALGTARPALALRFGVTFRRSRSFTTMRDTYRGALARGVTAGRFTPAPEPPPADPEAARRALMQKREETAAALHAEAARWGERSLDHLRLPHPAMGPLTVREMLFFTLYHNLHHVLVVARRKGWLAQAGA